MSIEHNGLNPYQLAELAITAIQAECYDQAEQLLIRSLSLEISNGPSSNQAADWGNLGLVLGLKGRMNAAIRCLWRAYQLHLHGHDFAASATDLFNLAELFDCVEDRQLVRLCLAGAARHLEQAGSRQEAVDARRRLALDFAIEGVATREPMLN